MSNFDPMLFAKQSEEMETMLSQCGPLVKAYYDTLEAAGLPPEFARELTLRWYDRIWDRWRDE